MPSWLFVSRKPTLVGRESQPTADRDTGAIIFVEPYEEKDLVKDKEFVSTYVTVIVTPYATLVRTE